MKAAVREIRVFVCIRRDEGEDWASGWVAIKALMFHWQVGSH